jgi:hypothetical protein
MKNFIIVLFALLTLFSCKKNNDNESIETCSKDEQYYTSDNNTTLNVINEQWYLTRNSIGGGSIHLKIAGSTNGDSATIRTYGDGMILDVELELNAEKEFEKDITISFTANSLPPGDITRETIIKVYREQDILQVKLKSCVLRY